MKLNSFEIGLVVDYYENEIARLQNRLDTIRSTKDEYDRDLRVTQMVRIVDQQRKFRQRMKELQDLEEMD